LYISNSDLRPYQRFINGAAIPVADILTDIDGETRNPLKPDIGADEFYIDFGVAEILNPGLQCEHGESDTVTALVKQYADIPFVDLALAYRLNAGNAVTATVPGYTYDDLTYTFETPVDLTAYGDYLITVFLVDAHDDNPGNDTLTAILYSYPPPIIDFAYQYCGGSTVYFSGQAIAAPPYSIDGYKWDFGDSTTASGISPSHTYLQSGTYVVDLKVYLNTGCYNEITGDIIIDVSSTEMVLNLVSDDESCSGLCDGQVHAMVKGGTPPYTYTLNGEFMAQPDMTGLCPGQYILKVNDTMGCLLTDTAVIKTITDIQATFEADTMAGYAPLTVHFHYTGTPGYNLSWDFGDDTYSSEQDPTHTYDTGGSYRVMLIVYSDTPGYCADTAYLAIGVSNAVNIRVYNVITPNGDGMNDYFEVDSEGLQTMTVTIFDRRGIKIYEIKDLHDRWDGRTSNGDDASTGTYFYILHAKGYDGKDYKKEGVITLLR
jgi:gliding motility-associated-like protein